MGQLMRHEAAVVDAFALPHPDMVAVGEGAGADAGGGAPVGGLVMNADVGKGDAKARLHERPDAVGQRSPGAGLGDGAGDVGRRVAAFAPDGGGRRIAEEVVRGGGLARLDLGEFVLFDIGGVDVFGRRDVRVLMVGGNIRRAFKLISVGLTVLRGHLPLSHNVIRRVVGLRCGVERGRRHGRNAIRHHVGLMLKRIVGGADLQRGLDGRTFEAEDRGGRRAANGDGDTGRAFGRRRLLGHFHSSAPQPDSAMSTESPHSLSHRI